MPIEAVKEMGIVVKESFDIRQSRDRRTDSSAPMKWNASEKVEKNGDVKAEGDDLEVVVSEVMDELKKRFQRDVKMTVDRDTDKVVIKIFDTENDKLIKQMPPEEILEASKRLDELEGILFNEEV